MVHIYFYSNTSSCMTSRGIDSEFKRQDLRNSIQCVLSYNRQVISTIIGSPSGIGDDSDVYFSVIVDRDEDDEWFNLFADAVICLLRYSITVFVLPFQDSDVILG